MIILSSIGLSAPSVLEEFRHHLKSIPGLAAIVTTAADDKEHDKYATLAQAQLETLGLRTIFVDLEIQPQYNFDQCDVIYVCGGNTYRLLKFARNSGFEVAIKSLLGRGGIYLGVSAGSLIMTPSIRPAGDILADENTVGITDLKGFSIYKHDIVPHFEEALDAKTKEYEKQYTVHVDRVGNNQAIIIDNQGARLIG